MAAALRASSAFARRSLAASSTPLPAAPLGSFIVSSSSSSSSSYHSSSSNTTSSSPASLRAYSSRASVISRSLGSSPLSTTSRWSGVIPTNLNQARTMSFDGKKIKVQNPVVELDGDEVWNCLSSGAAAASYIYLP